MEQRNRYRNRFTEPVFGLEKWPDGRYFETVPAENENGYVRREITPEEYEAKRCRARKMFEIGSAPAQ